MKNKLFDCVEMKRKGAEAIYRKVSSLSTEQQLEYWREGSAALRQQMRPANADAQSRESAPTFSL